MKILETSSKRLLATGYIALLIGATALGFTFAPQSTRAASTPVGIAIPLYTYPTDGTWTAVVQAKQTYPNVPFIAVINPNSGPGSSQDANYVQGIRNLQAAGVKVLGYVATGYGSNSISSVESQASAYRSWYGVDGIFFDEMSNSAGAASYYSTLNSYVHSLIPGSTTMGNPGTSVPSGLIGTLDILCVYESGGYPSISSVTYPGYSPSNFATIAYGVLLDTSFLASLSGVNGFVYATDANLPNPYDVLPSYFISEIAALSTIDIVATSSTSTTSTSSSGVSASLTVGSVDLSGNPITGMWTTWNQNGAVLATGYTPTTFTGTNGGTYDVTVSNYGNTVFCHWQDGNTNWDRTLVLNGNLALTAYYSTTGSCATTTTTTSTTSTSTTSTSSTTSTTTTTVATSTTKSTTATTSTSTTFSIRVRSATTAGASFSGMWTVVTAKGVTLATGYTPLTFTATLGGTYTITVANYGNTVFSHWSNGSTSPTITITPSQAMTLTAYYTVYSCPSNHRHC